MNDKYILKNKKTIPTDDIIEWGKWFETANRRVAETTLKNGLWVSTVFLGLDHNFLVGGKPKIFETMVFPTDEMGELDCERYSTWEEAEEGHKKMVKKWSKKEI